ncbi:G-D-S-L lipolytic protein [Psychrobacter urativorans]|uniref:G-D-S-L lipolytic protein n=1 Tax=Psychrobacter urativorans TaxID=45610 RepID=A0A0M4T9K1_9GAMM|nr:G-D-S-L lipolytic protein [Psychrobacter urativorans]
MVPTKTTTAKITATAKNVLLAPIYIYQGHKVKRDTVRLPEPVGDRCGHIQLNTINGFTTSNLPTLRLMIVGDSAAAGVGSQTQQQALAGQLIPALQQQSAIHTQFDEIIWSLQASTGLTSFDILRRLYVLASPSQPIDVMVLSVGVNDTTANVSSAKWRQQLEDIIAIAQRKFGVRQLIFCSLPPMAKMPALPSPLSGFIGAKAASLDGILQRVCNQHIYHQNKGVHYLAADFTQMAKENTHKDGANGAPFDASVMFASDGFHPSSLTYGYWAQQLADQIANLLDHSADKSYVNCN